MASQTKLEVARELYASGGKVDSETFQTGVVGEEILVIAVRRDSKGITKLSEWINRIQMQDGGSPCATCGGTGKV